MVQQPRGTKVTGWHSMNTHRPCVQNGLKWNRISSLVTVVAVLLLQQQPVVILARLSNDEEAQLQQEQKELSSPADDSNSDDWYKRYPAYPPYCSTPTDMEQRAIPVTADDARLGESRLLHVAAIIRHGARTPYKGDLNCWEGYQESEETGKWNCDLKTLTSLPTPKDINEEEGQGNQGGNAMFLFEKWYDALLDSKDHLANALGGTCQVGQLLLRGYDQEIVNGQHLRTAYLFDERKYAHDPMMRLIDISGQDSQYAWDTKNLYYRVDDDQRTVMSGQVLLRGMLGPEIEQFFESSKHYPVIPLHTADLVDDVLAPNEHVCPRLAEMRERYERSSAFQSFNQSSDAVQLYGFMKNVLKIDGEMETIDCLMTTMCTDRTLPDAVNDYTGNSSDGRELHNDDGDSDEDSGDDSSPDSYGKNIFQRLYDFDVKKYGLTILANDAEYSKLGIGPLWVEIMGNVNAIIKEEESICCPLRTPPKLALFSGHDTTIMPLLASLGPKVWDGSWPAYASMLLIEVHEINIDGRSKKALYKSNYAFRLLLNGNVLTHLLDDCPDDAELCDVDILREQVEPFAKMERDCAQQHGPSAEYKDTVSRAREILSTTGGVVAFFLLVVGSAVLGAFATFFYLTGNLPVRRRRRRQGPASALESYQEGGVALTGVNSGSNGSERYLDEPDEDAYDLGVQSRQAESAALEATIS